MVHPAGNILFGYNTSTYPTAGRVKVARTNIRFLVKWTSETETEKHKVREG